MSLSDTRPTKTLPDAVLWDLDGTIVDTEPVWLAAELSLASRYGASWSEQDGLELVGSDLLAASREMKRRMALPLSPEEIVDTLVAEVAAYMSTGEIAWRPGALELIGALEAAGVPQALVTMSYKAIATPMLARVPGEPFGAVVTGDVVSQGKPHPEPYLAAAAALGVDPHRCVAIEDSTTGTRSAAAAGCHVLVVPNLVAVEEGERRTLVDSLEGTRPYDLGALLDVSR
ncbi:HAD family phosphatase [Mumia sp. zg.B53]|uniref:HAD family hydrolase n=1 Tax=unclassified Mumia TaxID=2621872 RepID=UPI001C6F58D7|nr:MULTISPECIES: HAD family phosphatase [unclassified Mumia]MBW9205101.1 HAD family phosphatase [Mumia sp. zg.B17]MBW9208895.1 HAD family phosphatase [Mumia sp. zg.B21]MBW9213507.1 HAD family phosphatase [Mumia sp. zg.B53]MDD9348919.1 HAD family phosphatase [Mumia sp.]